MLLVSEKGFFSISRSLLNSDCLRMTGGVSVARTPMALIWCAIFRRPRGYRSNGISKARSPPVSIVYKGKRSYRDLLEATRKIHAWLLKLMRRDWCPFTYPEILAEHRKYDTRCKDDIFLVTIRQGNSWLTKAIGRS